MFRNVHALTPDANHDEAARMDFVRAFRAHLSGTIMPGNFSLYGREDQAGHRKGNRASAAAP